MAEFGEWNSKGATLSDVTAHKEYGVSRDFIVNGIRSGNLGTRGRVSILFDNTALVQAASISCATASATLMPSTPADRIPPE
jgi:hypothetical protein